MPLKSRIRGSATFTNRSRNSYIRSPRRVTLHPIGTPVLSLNPASDFLARVTTGFCPVTAESSSTAESITFTFATASPSPILMTTFDGRGTCQIFLYLNCLMRAGAITSRKRSRSRGRARRSIFDSLTSAFTFFLVLVTSAIDLPLPHDFATLFTHPHHRSRRWCPCKGPW